MAETQQSFNPEDIAKTIMNKSFLQKRGKIVRLLR
jgi:hypothetical protein